jgi:hypothetical protein
LTSSLAIGSPLSRIDLLISKTTSINAKHGPFDACVVVGDMFKEGSDGSELDDAVCEFRMHLPRIMSCHPRRLIAVPLPTYFTIGQNPLPSAVKDKILATGGEVASNLVFLGKAAQLSTAQGLKLAAIGGAYDESHSASDADALSHHLSSSAVNTLLSNPLLNPLATDSFANAKAPLPPAFHGLDLLLLPSAPPGVSQLSTSFAASGVNATGGQEVLADAIKGGRPRYVFWSDPQGFWEREPFGWASGASEDRWTRCVKLGALGSEQKARVSITSGSS